jgi:hypothetical protein
MKTLALLLLASAANAAPCNLSARVVSATPPASIGWDKYIGASSYHVTESRDDFLTTRTYLAMNAAFAIPHRVSEPTKFQYRIEALFDPTTQIDGGCRGSVELTLTPDAEFRRITRKAIVPIVGSVVGATGARFRTSLRLTSNAGNQRGRIVFHPAGPASDSDPSIRYAFEGLRKTLSWDDIVNAIGASGIGTLDIIPDDDAEPAPPTIVARHYTEGPNGGTFGSFEPAVVPFDFLAPPQMTITIPDPRFRINVGFRTITSSSVQALIFDASGQVRALKSLNLGKETLTFAAASQLFGELAVGETVSMSFDGSVVPFYTITENATNDPAVIVPSRRETLASARYVE